MNVIYARVDYSPTNDLANPIENQIETCRRYAESQGYTIDKVYVDEGVSGLNDDRAGLNELLVDSDNIKNVFVKDASRLYRDVMKLHEFMIMLHDKGIDIYASDMDGSFYNQFSVAELSLMGLKPNWHKE